MTPQQAAVFVRLLRAYDACKALEESVAGGVQAGQIDPEAAWRMDRVMVRLVDLQRLLRKDDGDGIRLDP